MYLLSTHVFAELIGRGCEKPSSSQAKSASWYDQLADRNVVFVSASSLGVVLRTANRLAEENPLQSVRANIYALLNDMGGVVAIEQRAAETWAKIRPLDLPTIDPPMATYRPMSNERKWVVASAISADKILVEHRQPYHSTMSSLFGLKTVSPTLSSITDF